MHLFLIGFQKSGTSTLHAMLSRHPDVSPGAVKEPFFFEFAFNRSEFKNYLGSYDGIPLDASTSYIYNPKALQRINENIEDPRYICLLRDPVRRAFSAYLHMRNKVPGVERRPFRKILACCAKTGEEHCLIAAKRQGTVTPGYQALSEMLNQKVPSEAFRFAYRYFQSSRYSEYLGKLPPGRTIIIGFEQLLCETECVMRDLLDNLNLDFHAPCAHLVKKNPTRIPRWPLAPITRFASRAGLGHFVKNAFIRKIAYEKNPRLPLEDYRAARKLLESEYAYWRGERPAIEREWREPR